MINPRLLEIGSYVSYRDKMPSKVVALDDNSDYIKLDNGSGVYWSIHKEKLEYVKITEEILIQLGFRKRLHPDKTVIYYDLTDEIHVLKPIPEEEKYLFSYWNEETSERIGMQVETVSELQRLLKACRYKRLLSLNYY